MLPASQSDSEGWLKVNANADKAAAADKFDSNSGSVVDVDEEDAGSGVLMESKESIDKSAASSSTTVGSTMSRPAAPLHSQSTPSVSKLREKLSTPTPVVVANRQTPPMNQVQNNKTNNNGTLSF